MILPALAMVAAGACVAASFRRLWFAATPTWLDLGELDRALASGKAGARERAGRLGGAIGEAAGEGAEERLEGLGIERALFEGWGAATANPTATATANPTPTPTTTTTTTATATATATTTTTTTTTTTPTPTPTPTTTTTPTPTPTPTANPTANPTPTHDPSDVRIAILNEHLQELDWRVQRWARVPRVCASIATSAGLLLATLALRQGLMISAELPIELQQAGVHAALMDALNVAAVGLAGTAFCIAIQRRARWLAKEQADAADRLVDHLEALAKRGAAPADENEPAGSPTSAS